MIEDAEIQASAAQAEALVHRDGHRVRFLDVDPDEDGARLLIEHVWTQPGTMAGPHWHPVLTECFTVREGAMRFRVDGRDLVLRAGEHVTVEPGQVHQFRNDGGRLVVLHEVRPPGRHRAMFAMWHHLDQQGRTFGPGIPRDPLWLALLWELQEGYLAGPPLALQRLVLGGLARLARRVHRLPPSVSASLGG